MAELPADGPAYPLADAGSSDSASAAPERGFTNDAAGGLAGKAPSSDLDEHEDAGTNATPSDAAVDPCLGDVAARIFQYAFCTCADLQFVSFVTTLSFDSIEPLSLGAPEGAPMGSNAGVQTTFPFTIGGDLIVAGVQGLSIPQPATINGNLSSPSTRTAWLRSPVNRHRASGRLVVRAQ